MDQNGYIYDSLAARAQGRLSEEVIREDEARLDGYLRARAEADEERRAAETELRRFEAKRRHE